MRNTFNRPRQVNVDRGLETFAETAVDNRPAYSQLMSARIAARRRQVMADAWTYFKRGAYFRALAGFDLAQTVAPNDPAPPFGQLMAVVANRHHMRALHKVAKLARYDASRPSGATGMFEHNFSLQDALGSPDELTAMLDSLREFVRANPDNPHVQALHCVILWYTRRQDAMIEARSMAARIKRTHPASPWAQFVEMIEAAQRETRDAAPA